MAGPGAGWVLAGAVFCGLAAWVSANEDCLWFLDKNGSWHPGFDCEFFSFCCGDCQQRYCCRDPMRIFSERQQKRCVPFSRKTIAGIASAISLFIMIVAIVICCFMCSCCYMYRRRQEMRTPYQHQEMQMTGYPVQATYPVQPMYPVDPKYGPPPPQQGYGPMYPPNDPSGQYPVYPPGPAAYNPAAPPPYLPPQPMGPGPDHQRPYGY